MLYANAVGPVFPVALFGVNVKLVKEYNTAGTVGAGVTVADGEGLNGTGGLGKVKLAI